jgi:transposase
MDVHVRNSVLNAKDANGQVLARGRCGNTMMELGSFFAPVERRARVTGEAIRVVMESTTNSRAIQRLLTQYGREAGIDLTAEVLHARKLRIIAESVNKCDRVDTNVLTELSRSNLKLPSCYIPDDEEFALREHLRARSDLVRMRTMLKNRVHAVLHRRGILAPSGELFGKAGRNFLAQLQLDQAGRIILERYLVAMDHIDRSVDQSTASLKELSHQPRWAKPAALLQTMPGIGLLTALTILAELGDRTRFRSRAAVANYAGLVPRQRSSDQKSWSGGITRQGPSHLRAMLGEAAWMAMPRVPVYRALFERVEHKKGKRTAIVAVARRMLEDGWTLLQKDEAFRYVPASVGDADGKGDSHVGQPCRPSISVAGASPDSSVAG